MTPHAIRETRMLRSTSALRRLLVLAVVAAGFALAACEYHKVDKDGNRERINKEEYDRLRGE
ncbi:MAG: hypothetical protein AAGB29_12540 [Planctomycetota bacterium]